jgi:hypothetical protein
MVEFFMGLLGTVVQTLEYKDNKSSQRSELISALNEALRYTKKHIEKTRSEYGDAESEIISENWSKVAKLMRPFNEVTANILEMKADYWLNPNGFKEDIQNNSRRFDFRFRIVEVEKMIDRLNNKI